jgi:hypothetical protein
VIKDTPYDHLTKLNFRQTIQEMNIFNFIKDRNGFMSNNNLGLTPESKSGRSMQFCVYFCRSPV